MTDSTPAAPSLFLIHSPKFYFCRYLFITDKSKRHVLDLVEFLGSNFTDGGHYGYSFEAAFATARWGEGAERDVFDMGFAPSD